MQQTGTLINFIPPIAHTHSPPIANTLLTHLIKSCCWTVERPDEIPAVFDKHIAMHVLLRIYNVDYFKSTSSCSKS